MTSLLHWVWVTLVTTLGCGLSAAIVNARRLHGCPVRLDPDRPDGLPTVDETGQVCCPPTSVRLGPVKAVG